VMDLTERKQDELLLAGEKRLLEMINRGDPRALILDALCRLFEDMAPGSLSSILLLDANTNSLRHGAGPSLPTDYIEAIDGIVIGPSVGSCGTAAHLAEPVIVSDIATDPLWADFRELALAHGLRACWSSPILSSEQKVLGTFATYYREPRSPTPQEQSVIEQITHLASIAVEREQAEAALREQANLLNLTRDSIFVRDMDDVITYWNRGAEELYGWRAEQAVGRVSHQLTQTVFPAPIDEIRGEVLRTGRWEGELVHTKANGSRVIVASRWALQSDAEGKPLAVLETNNDITASKRAEQALEDLAGRLIHAQEEERSRIGRELHDHISQTLGLLTIKIDQLRASGEITPALEGALDELRQETSDITNDVHRLSHRLHSSTLDYLGLVPALQKLVAEFSERHDIAITFAHASLPASVPSEIGLCLFRIAEESLTNIAKHSQARSAKIHVAGAPDGIHLTVEDAGTGFDLTALGSKRGLGFVSMQERLRLLHGTIHVDSAPSRGTRIDAWVPPGLPAGAPNKEGRA
jgi:PAS domain S-box-containing protein